MLAFMHRGLLWRCSNEIVTLNRPRRQEKSASPAAMEPRNFRGVACAVDFSIRNSGFVALETEGTRFDPDRGVSTDEFST
ncbi:hypothetical protein EVAR_33138_1 [Eumeta japonica]|uniref:Uncharacterized protein n=1 Tax=Eumeta variegata TaxID=151549 RepID=A0A4C1YB81_EUMVA|nr:hypothetical protein EVAR_33138_1 [Eumeta japonica]